MSNGLQKKSCHGENIIFNFLKQYLTMEETEKCSLGTTLHLGKNEMSLVGMESQLILNELSKPSVTGNLHG